MAAALILDQGRIRVSPSPVAELALVALAVREDAALPVEEVEYVIVAARRGSIDNDALNQIRDTATAAEARNG
jgi:hypothetical protein